MNISRFPFGITAGGRQIDSIRLENSRGCACEIITYGAYLISFKAPDRTGRISEITRRFPDLASYEQPGNFYGASIGRYANRISNAAFMLDGSIYHLRETSDHCMLHGGPGGFHTKIWEAFPMRESERAAVKLTLTSEDQDQGFPGTLDVAMTITLTEKNELMFLYEAVSDAPTPVSLTNHTYWNLRGEITQGSIYDQIISIESDSIAEVDDALLPTGNFLPVSGTVFDLRRPTPIGQHISIPNHGVGYDNNYLLSHERRTEVRKAAEVHDPISGRHMEVLTNAPGLQFYSDNFSKPNHAAYCLEAGELPDAMNQPDFPSPVIRPGELYRQLTIHIFSIIE